MITLSRIKSLAAELSENKVAETPSQQEEAGGPAIKKFECKLCGYVYEGDSLPADFKCPLCGRGAEDFAPVE